VPFARDDTELTAYDLFDADGIYVSSVWLNSVPSHIIGGKMYAYSTDKDGYRVIKRFRLIWSD
jgi:hypothetical protein